MSVCPGFPRIPSSDAVKGPLFSRLFGGKRRDSPADLTEAAPLVYGIPEVLSALADRRALPADIREIIEDGEANPDACRSWFRAETPDHVEVTVRRLADLTRQYGARLLQGDPDEFQILQERQLKESEAWKRRKLLGELPRAVATQCQDLSTAELECRANEYLKAHILAKYGDELSDIRELPADVFVQRYLSRQVKRG